MSGARTLTAYGGAAHELRTSFRCGMVDVNVPIPAQMGYGSVGGWRYSLLGHLQVHGRKGVVFDMYYRARLRHHLPAFSP